MVKEKKLVKKVKWNYI